jgi:exonuclease SbcD
MKILHTADWHLGKSLHKYSLEPDNQLFLNWLIELIKERKTDLLLVSGDIFDTANPKNSTLAMYYNFLKELIPLKCRVIITGGNHDSPSLLNAPRDILNLLNISVVGTATESIEDELIIVKDDSNKTLLQVAAVPYLRDADIRKSVAGNSYSNQLKQISEGIKTHYGVLSEILIPNIPSIAMGHLYVQGASTSDSEREVHTIGGVAAFTSDNFPEAFDYIALGHIHKPQRIADSDFIRYSGSPISLSFSERKDQKYVIELTLENAKLSVPELVDIPKFRELKRLKGTVDEVWKVLEAYQSSFQLPTLMEILVEEEAYDPNHTLRFNLMNQEFENHDFAIVISKLTYQNKVTGTAQLFAIGENVASLSPKEIFLKRIEGDEIEAKTRRELVEAFDELLREVSENS